MSDSDLNFIGSTDAQRHPERDGDLAAISFQERADRERKIWRAVRWVAVLAILAIAYLLSGCGITPVGQQAQQAISVGISAYCLKTPQERAVIRNLVAARIAPNRVAVQCADDEKI